MTPARSIAPTRWPRLALAVVASLLGLGGLVGLTGCGDSGYRRVGSEWHYGEHPVAPHDAASFRVLNDTFARDARRGYYRGGAVPGSDGTSFEALSEHEARDARAVYWADTYRNAQEYWSVRHLRIDELPQADPASYRVLGHGYARDRRRLWFEGQSFEARDLASFEPLNALFARDAQRGYYERTEIAGSDGPSFGMLDAHDLHYARDRRQVYYAWIDIDSEPNRARPRAIVVRGADPASFRSLAGENAPDGADAADATRRYRRGLPLPPATN